MMKKYTCIIIDDDEIDRLTVLSFAKKFPILDILGVFDSAEEALPFIEKQKVDILFLDIDMPELNGIEFRKQAMEIPVCIFITAHPEHAVESFQIETLDFIVKPLKLERFAQTVNRIEEFMEIRLKASLFEASIGGDTIYIKEGHDQTKVKLHEILYLEALKDYTLIITDKKRHCVLSSIGNLLKEDHFQSFIRIHRSYAVQKQFIQKMNSTEIILNNNITIPVGRSYKENLNLI
ncbi:LytR/AlgR family response regulator transcription factor [Flavobacterium johnsoniae]|uniref:Two component transcriptional regulator, LytTR family n=1 Tax=Flavobacterium johnsoniae (strain ATCC 17061 / DSM 2064 / JCM 8514 / BCRC 14874 / CCUG 350202 / NBRC 14942 / NCIMB 11054 / UW101) TaxID=376686 RepID=A5FKA0_FLAJ1|nr:LytTR family DNA-binding domain-containing protein [Flavobacterium johnsoniae]ABQ04377.1 two component transcriptional regulator, LytTR family [Flavobacterium johnsoniae UW101]OXE97704.1 DNA-binding response regulator [Flavobacterium johnsoniae UW101]WQG83829.1 LytTR family DNA-binding domain-containing protein [Flavobacterium johnsoniae UW101]SHK20725.1 two component transcriptional regulator, LytTR family [Flavobacterium johnsoniae]